MNWCRGKNRCWLLANVRLRGEDIQAGTIVIERGTVLRPQELGLIASLGKWQVLVHRRPRVALLSTKNEFGIAEYPDSDKVGVWAGDKHYMLRRSDHLDYWDGEK